jgi:signal transduction histidine kinase
VASRLEAGVFSVEPRATSVRAIVQPMLAVFTPVATRRRVALEFEGSLELEVYADAQKLRQALDNLLANALKLTPRGGRVRVRVSQHLKETVFEISDSGPGVAPQETEAIFDRYRQGSHGRVASPKRIMELSPSPRATWAAQPSGSCCLRRTEKN